MYGEAGMAHMDQWCGLILLVVITLATTANSALRHFSRARLAEELEARGRAWLLNQIVEHRGDLIFSTSVIRVCAMLALVLLMTHLFVAGPGDGVPREYATIFASALLVLLVFGVAIPNAWARYGGDGFLIVAGPILVALRYALWPLLAVEHVADGLVRRLAGVSHGGEQEAEAEQIEREILGVVSEGEAAGTVHEQDADMIASVIEFRDKDVSEIMTPRTEIVALPTTTTLYEAKETIVREGHSRIPIYAENIDNVLGVLYAKDLLNCDEHETFNPTEIMRKVPFVPETKRLPDLLAEMREKKVQVAIVVDEYGGTAGLVTIEDIIEEIVGEISDEYDPAEPESIRRVDEWTAEVDARAHIDEVNEALGIELPDGGDYDTVGGFLFSQMGKIPTAGEELTYGNVRLRVLDAEARKIHRLRIEVIPETKPV